MLFATFLVVKPRDLLIMRHAKSAWDTDAPSDWHRPLAPRGQKAAVQMAGWMNESHAIPDRILCSDAIRAIETIDLVRETLRIDDATVDTQNALYGCAVRTWISAIREAPAKCLLVCGHNPELNELAQRLCTARLPRDANGKLLTTAAIAHLRFADGEITENSGELIALVRPKELS